MSRVSGRWKLGLLLASNHGLPVGCSAHCPQRRDGNSGSDHHNILSLRYRRSAIESLYRFPIADQNSLLTPAVFDQESFYCNCLVAGLLLTGNYGLYILGLNRTTAEATQLMIQVAPMLLLLSGLWVFGERFSRAQWIGFSTFFSGLLMFFYPHFYGLFVAMNDYGVGVLMVLLAAVLWTGYAILQKFLLREFSSQETMLVFYWIGALAFLPFTDFSSLPQLTNLQWWLLLFCGLNTLIAYGSFAEAMVHIEASKVSTVLALTPLITFAIVHTIPFSGLAVEPLTPLSISGAILVVVGSMVTALNKVKG